MLNPNRAVDNILEYFKRCGFREVSHNRCFLLAIVEGIYDEMIENGDIIIKKPVEVKFSTGELKIKKGVIATDNGYVPSANILNGNIDIENGKIIFTKVIKEEYRIV